MTDWNVLNEAHQALKTVVAGVPAEGWDLPTPCEKWNVTQVLQHSAGDQLAYAARITGSGGPTEDPFAPSGTLDSAPSALLEPALSASANAFATLSGAEEEVDVPLPPFKLPAVRAVEAAALDAAVHAWDIAVATGQPSPLTPALAAALRPVADILADPLRGFAYGPALAAPSNADDAASLLAYLGRDPGWAH
jgi:uncharacterized protein (TIGR03086 family)